MKNLKQWHRRNTSIASLKNLTVILCVICLPTACLPKVTKNEHNSANADKSNTIPFNIYKQGIYFTVVFDSISGNFVYDTGADHLLFDSIFYQNSNFEYKHIGHGILPGIGNNFQQVDIIGDSVNYTITNKDSLFPPLSSTFSVICKLKQILGDYADGLIPHTIFDNKIIKFNFSDKYIAFLDSIDKEDVFLYDKIPLEYKENRLLLKANLFFSESDSIEGNFILDFGAGGAIYCANNPITNTYFDNLHTEKRKFYTKNSGFGGDSRDTECYINKIKIGKYSLKKPTASYSQDEKGALGKNRKENGLLGLELLKRFDVIIDYRNNMLYLKPNECFNDDFFLPYLSFTYTNRKETLGGWLVTGLYEGENAEKSGLRIGDMIREINGNSILTIDYEDEQAFIKSIRGQSVEVSIIRGKHRKTINISL